MKCRMNFMFRLQTNKYLKPHRRNIQLSLKTSQTFNVTHVVQAEIVQNHEAPIGLRELKLQMPSHVHVNLVVFAGDKRGDAFTAQEVLAGVEQS